MELQATILMDVVTFHCKKDGMVVLTGTPLLIGNDVKDTPLQKLVLKMHPICYTLEHFLP